MEKYRNKSIEYKAVILILFLFFITMEIRLVKMQVDYTERIDFTREVISSGKFTPKEKLEAEISTYETVINDINLTTIYLTAILLIMSAIIIIKKR